MEGVEEAIGKIGQAAADAGFENEVINAGKTVTDMMGGDGGLLPGEILLYLIKNISGFMKENASLIMLLAAICVFSALASGISAGSGCIGGAAETGFSVIASLPAAGIFIAAFTVASMAMTEMERIGLAVLPALAVLGTGSASGGYTASAQLMSLMLRRIFLPAAAIYGVLSYCGAVSGENYLSEIKRTVKNIFVRGLGIVMTVFTFCSAASGLTAGAAATLGGRVVKYAGSLVPLVGPYLSDAADTIIESAALIRTAGGVFAAITVVSVGLIPFMKLLAYYLAVNILSAVAGSFADGKTKEITAITCELTGMLIGLTALMGGFFIINIALLAMIRG